MEAPVAVHASAFSIVGHTTCSSTACSAFTVPNSARFAPSAIARVRTTSCASVLVCALCMQWHASSSACCACLGVGMVCVEPHAAGLSTCTMQASCCTSFARPAVAISASAVAASSASPHGVTPAKKLDDDTRDSLLDVLEGGPSGSEGGGESDGAGPPASLHGPVGVYGIHSRWLGPACRPRRMAVRSSPSSRGRPRRWSSLSYSRRSFSACSCSLRCSSPSRRSLEVCSCSLRSSSCLPRVPSLSLSLLSSIS
eukprot:scaffold2960_cov61-Phaeocystis_antarctica.AAC.3